MVKLIANTADEEHAVKDTAASSVQTNLETTVIPESPEVTVGFDKQKDSAT
ncbi:hypothetical protein A2U01_0106139, partial [Trifolium medium]|nr:hypothetical protein [Trifolium medium]